MNEVKLQGQITSDPEVKESRNGILRGSFLLTTKGGTEDRPRYDYTRMNMHYSIIIDACSRMNS